MINMQIRFMLPSQQTSYPIWIDKRVMVITTMLKCRYRYKIKQHSIPQKISFYPCFLLNQFSIVIMRNIQPLSLHAEAQYELFKALFSSCQQDAKQIRYVFIKRKLERRDSRLIRYISYKSSGRSN